MSASTTLAGVSVHPDRGVCRLCALDVAGAHQLPADARAGGGVRHGIGALAMGGGTWAMHFIEHAGVQAPSPAGIAYDPNITLVSILNRASWPAVCSSM